nr:hypothetical protein CFP56_19927 [Quercus suber]
MMDLRAGFQKAYDMGLVSSIQMLFGHKFIDAVLNEWQRTMMDLPAGFQKAYDMRAETLGIVEFPILGRISKLAISWDSLIWF